MIVRRINENIAYAKSVLVKNGISPESPEYQDYLKIREICGNDNGYVGILTKLRFVDKVTDMDEIKSIYEVLKKSRFDFAKLNKLTYEQILDMFYDELSGEKVDKTDIELVLKDKTYSYYRVHTYKGILKIGSPTWCLKTKSNWDRYQAKYPNQFVVIDNRYKNRIVSPDDNYLHNYKSTKGWIRYGVSVSNKNEDGTYNWVGNDDNNSLMSGDISSYTAWGVLRTILNLMVGVKKPYYEWFTGCTDLSDELGYKTSWRKCSSSALDVMGISKNSIDLSEGSKEGREAYVSFSETYSSIPVFLVFDESIPYGYFPSNSKHDLKWASLTGKSAKDILEIYAKKNIDYDVYTGVNYNTKNLTIENIKSNKKFITIIDDKWVVYNRNDNYYLVTNIKPVEYQLPTFTNKEENKKMEDPLYFYIDKKTGVGKYLDDKHVVEIVYNQILNFNNKKEDTVNTPIEPVVPKVEPEKKVKGFWDFLKRR